MSATGEVALVLLLREGDAAERTPEVHGHVVALLPETGAGVREGLPAGGDRELAEAIEAAGARRFHVVERIEVR